MMRKVTGRAVGFGAIASMCVLVGPLVGTSFADAAGSSVTPAPVGSSSSPVGTSAAVVVVSPSAMNGWSFVNDATNALEAGTFVTGPATPPMGTGSVQLATPTAADGHIIATQAYAGTPLSSITALTYSTYQTGPPSPLAIALQFDVRYRTADTHYGGRLVYEPYQNGAVTVPAGWHQWDAINAGLALWWASKTNAFGSNGACPQSSPCTWAAIQTLFPQAEILPGGNLLLKAGSNWAGFTGDADALTVGVTGANTTYDFGPDAVAVTPPGSGSGGGTPAGGGPAVTFTLGATGVVTPGGAAAILGLGATNPFTSPTPVQVGGKQVTRTPSSHHQSKSPNSSSSSSWLWWLLLIIALAFAGFIWFLFARSRTAGA
jgi:hypothetical protein